MRLIIFIYLFFLSLNSFAQYNFFQGLISNKCSIPRVNCLAHLNAKCTSSGIYKIRPPGESGHILLYCDQVSDGGGWTLVAKIERNVTPGNLEFEGTVSNNNQAVTASAAPNLANGLNAGDLSVLQNPNVSGRSGYTVKISNARINSLKSSSASNYATYKVERKDTSGALKLFYPGSCIFQLHGYGNFGSNTACQKATTSYTDTNFVSASNVSWCVQPNMPTQYFCSGAAVGLLRINESQWTGYVGHNYFDTLLWIR